MRSEVVVGPLDRCQDHSSDHDDVLASRRRLGQLHRHVSERAPQDGLVQLGQLSGNRHRPVRSARLNEVGECLGDPLRRLVEDSCSRLRSDLGKLLGPHHTLAFEEALEHETVIDQPTCHQGTDHRGRPWHDLNRKTRTSNCCHYSLTRVGDARHPGVAHQSDGLSSSDSINDLSGSIVLGVLVGHQQRPLWDAREVKKSPGPSRVLACDQVSTSQGVSSPRRQVTQVADWCANNEQSPAHASPLV